jgi:lycopene cyclase domain-containing protein
MPEYTFLALVSVILVLILDFFIVQTKLITNPKFWLFQVMCFVLQFFTDGFLTWRPIYIVNPEKILKIYLFTTPLENFIFGFSMLTLTVLSYEWLTRVKLTHQST